jgi:hypothetical protein
MIASAAASVWLTAELNVLVGRVGCKIQQAAPEDGRSARNLHQTDGTALPHSMRRPDVTVNTREEEERDTIAAKVHRRSLTNFIARGGRTPPIRPPAVEKGASS